MEIYLADSSVVDSALLPVATIDEAVAGNIDKESLLRGLTVRFPQLEGLQGSGDVYVNLAGYGAELIFFLRHDQGVIPPLQIQADKSSELIGKRVGLYYNVGGRTSVVGYFNAAMDTPEALILPFSGYQIPADAVAAGLVLELPPYAGMSSGDVLSFFLISRNGSAGFVRHLELQGDDVGQAVRVPLDPGFSRALVDIGTVEVSIYYSILSGGSRRLGPLAIYRVQGNPRPLNMLRSGGEEVIRTYSLIYTDGLKQALVIPASDDLQEGDIQTVLCMDGGFQRGFSFDEQRKVYDGRQVLVASVNPQEYPTGFYLYAQAFTEHAAGNVLPAPFARFQFLFLKNKAPRSRGLLS